MRLAVATLSLILMSSTAYAEGFNIHAGSDLLPLPNRMPRDGVQPRYQAPSYPVSAYQQPVAQYGQPAPLYQQSAQPAYAQPQAAQPAYVPPQAPQPVAEPAMQPHYYEAPTQTAYAQPDISYAAAPAAYDEPAPMSSLQAPRWYAAINLQAVNAEDWGYTESVPPYSIDADIEFETSFGMSGAVGYQVMPYLRVEGELGFMQQEVDNVSVNVYQNGTLIDSAAATGNDQGFEAVNFMANAYVDVPLEFAPSLLPYVGAGIGWSKQTNGAEESSLAYQGMAGVGYRIADKAVVNIGYRYFEADGFDYDTVEYDASSHIVEIGLRGYF